MSQCLQLHSIKEEALGASGLKDSGVESTRLCLFSVSCSEVTVDLQPVNLTSVYSPESPKIVHRHFFLLLVIINCYCLLLKGFSLFSILLQIFKKTPFDKGFQDFSIIFLDSVSLNLNITCSFKIL